MISKNQLILAEQEHWDHTRNTVDEWAKSNVPDQYAYNSRSAYWGSALLAGIINNDMYDYARTRYGNLWDYVGD